MPLMNPLLQPWTAPFGLPPFESLRPEHFEPAFERLAFLVKISHRKTSADPPCATLR